MYKLSLAASIYFIWRKQNLHIFQGKARLEVDVSSAILEAIRAKLSTWSVVRFTTLNSRICDDWLLDSKNFEVNS